MTEELEAAPELEQDKVSHIDKRTSERRETVYVVLAQYDCSDLDEPVWMEVDRIDASDRRQAILKAHENRQDSVVMPDMSRYKAVPQSSWKTLEIGHEPQPPKAVVREVD